jgi:3-dehydroquinate synthase
MQKTIHVRPGKNRSAVSYDVTVEPGSLKKLPALLAGGAAGRQIFLVADTTVARLYARTLRLHLERAGASALLLTFPAGEASKTGETAANLHTALLMQGIRRNDVIVAVGGGVTGDLGGYVAATILRGIEFVQVPTSLLAQVDSSVGGKVGVDHPLGKNMIGAFHQPSAVYIDPQVLRSLPPRQYTNGLAEVVKIAAALDAAFFRWLERHVRAIRGGHEKTQTEMIARAVGLKAAVVEKDELDAGLRNVLNLGHTIGHAAESASGYRLLHGEAVAIGLVLEARIAGLMGILKEEEESRLTALLQRLSLPTRLPGGIEPRSMREALSLDKKGTRQGARFVLLRGIGKSAIGVPAPSELLDEVLNA